MIHLGNVFRQNLKTLMDRRKWSQADLAERMECTQPYISQLLTGAREPGLTTVEKVAGVFGVTPESLLKEKK